MLTSWLEHVVRLYLTSIKQERLRVASAPGLYVLKRKTEKERKEVGN